MKFTSFLLAGLLVTSATGASAFDLMHPFWGPAKNQFASDTNYQFSRENEKHYVNAYSQSVAEKISYGLTDNWTVFAGIARTWSKIGGLPEGLIDDGHSKYTDWNLGTSFNFINDGKHFLQGALSYLQGKGNNSGEGAYKNYTVKGLYGYNFESVTPYLTLLYRNSLNEGKNNDPGYTVAVAAYKKLADKVGANLGVEYNHETSSYIKGTYNLTADVSYMITDKVAVKVFGDYLLHEKAKKVVDPKTQNRYTIGANLKVAF